MTRDDEELADRDSICAELAAFIERLRKHAGNFGAVRDAYTDLANVLEDDISDFRGASAFRRIEREMQEEGESRDHEERVELRRAYNGSVL